MRNNIRNMRKSTILQALFPKVRQGVLAATFNQPEKWWYLSELASRLGTSPSSLQRELASLVASGILARRREGTRAYFRAETQSPVFRDLRQLFEKTAGVIPTLERMLTPFHETIRSAFVYGSMARGRERATSDVDLMIIGEVGHTDLARALHKTEARLGREINVTVYSPEEFREKMQGGDHFLTTVLRGPKQFAVGGPSDLDEITSQ
jgi:predicted nucleotidyltransferase